MISVPPRKDDSAAEFRRQQDAIAKQVEKKLQARLDAEIKKLLDKEGKK